MQNSLQIKTEISTCEVTMNKIRLIIKNSKEDLQTTKIYRARKDILRTMAKRKAELKKMLNSWI